MPICGWICQLGKLRGAPWVPLQKPTDEPAKFPGPYMFKVIGLAERGFVARTVAAVREELIAPVDPPFRVRETAGGKHVAVTLHPTVQTARQVLDVYARLRSLTGLLFLW